MLYLYCNMKHVGFCLVFSYLHRLYAGPETQWAVYSSGRSGERGGVIGQFSRCVSGLFL